MGVLVCKLDLCDEPGFAFVMLIHPTGQARGWIILEIKLTYKVRFSTTTTR